jgi:hypothetical protein
MTKFFVAAAFAAAAFAATPSVACDWNRQASARDPVVATTEAPAGQPASQAAANPAEPANIAADAAARKPADEPTAPVVLVTDRH